MRCEHASRPFAIQPIHALGKDCQGEGEDSAKRGVRFRVTGAMSSLAPDMEKLRLTSAGAQEEEAREWTPVQFFSRSPGSRVFPSAVVHGDSLYVFGGHDGTVYRNDLLIFNLDTRTWLLDLDVTGEGPSPRDAHAAVVHAEWMYVFGGYDSKRYLNEYVTARRSNTRPRTGLPLGSRTPPRRSYARYAPRVRAT